MQLKSRKRRRRLLDAVPIRLTGADVGAYTVRGPAALAALAFGASAGGALAIGALSIGRASIRKLSIGDLEVRRLHVEELVVDRQENAGGDSIEPTEVSIH